MRHWVWRGQSSLEIPTKSGRFINVGPSGDSFGVLALAWSFASVPVKRSAPYIAMATSDSDSLSERAKRGEREALDQIVRAEIPRVERLLVRMLGRRDDLKDLVQTVFFEMVRALPKFRSESSLSTFIGGITVHVARRAMRPAPWWRRRAPMPLEEPIAVSADPEREAVANEQLRRVRVALEAIAPKKRVAFFLWALEGMSPEEIAEITNASVSATRGRILHAQRELRAQAVDDPYLRELVERGGK